MKNQNNNRLALFVSKTFVSFYLVLRVLSIIILSNLILMCKTTDTNDEARKMNQLKDETSPYLLQHVYNPVDWHPWNPKTLAKAKAENKMMIISVGYAACHWCHVMEHESFEDSLVASIMNEHFIPVKVDREERPDVDDVYMTACQLVSRRGCGWPLNALTLPDGRPFWATTYNPKAQWIQILEHFAKKYKESPEELEASADAIMNGIRQSEQYFHNVEHKIISPQELKTIAEKYLRFEDKQWGGRRGAPKFPMPDNFLFLHRYLDLYPDERLEQYVDFALTKMAYGGIYDHVGGGFARYSVDQKWLVPHFEKMLYDNAQLVQLYAEAYQRTQKPLYRSVVEKTLQFVDAVWSDQAGGFYSSLDADSEGVEGKYYVWTEAQIDRAIGDKERADRFKRFYNIKARGNWENGHNILFQTQSLQQMASTFAMTEQALQRQIVQDLDRLKALRRARVRPGLDDKVLSSWNALMIKGYVAAYRALQKPEYLARAEKAMQFLLHRQLGPDLLLKRNYKNGRSTINGFLDDYAFVIDALLELYQTTFKQQYLEKARELSFYALDRFFDSETGFFFYTSDLDDPLITRKKEMNDNVTPSSNAVMAVVLYKLGQLYDNKHFLNTANNMAKRIAPSVLQADMPHFYSHWSQMLLRQVRSPKEVAIVGKKAPETVQRLWREDFFPNELFLGSVSPNALPLLKGKYQDGKTMIYVCQNKTCKYPTSDISKAIELIKE